MIEFVSIFILSCIVLAKSGQIVVKSLSNLAKILKWREFVVATILMALASSSPEIFVGITASLSDSPQLAVGNILGSNIILLTLVLGVGAIFTKKLELGEKTFKRGKFFACVFTILPLLLIFDGFFSRSDGVILIIGFLFYLKEVLREQRRFSKIFNKIAESPFEKFKLFFKELAIFVFSVCLLILSAEGIVFSSEKIALTSGLSLIIIGVLGIALGTSLPEIAFGIRAIKTGRKEMMLGGTLGSVIVNSGLALGIVGIISPFRIFHFSLYFNAILFSFLASLFFLIFASTKNQITRREGFFLLFIYLIFVIFEVLLEIARF
ncbi:MAG: sodium:calcium antiporter [Candidatus Pacebacteria bacterium]|nr:sodium:calcium antiporter [Candidatus Paceibacterota bacterium]